MYPISQNKYYCKLLLSVGSQTIELITTSLLLYIKQTSGQECEKLVGKL